MARARCTPMSGGSFLWERAFSLGGLKIGEEGGEDADGGEERTEVVDKIEAGEVHEFAKKGRADAAHAKRKPEE